MDVQEWKTSRGSSQIPAFGNWNYVNDLPITQYFESARQAGLVRYSSSSGECDANSAADLYSVPHHRARAPPLPPPTRYKQGKAREKKGAQGSYNNSNKEGNIDCKKQVGGGKVFNVTVTELPPPSASGKLHSVSAVKRQHGATSTAPEPQTRRPPKAVDEDLYKIPPELLKRKRRLGFISRCLVPPCAV